jgi:type I restriction enzyme R subunit
VNEEDEHRKEVIEYLDKAKEKYRSLESYEKDVIDSFKHNEEGVEIIIVVDKLLTGFDAPRNTVLYLAKDLKDHNLLQAIARVNRLFENKALPKTAGFIVDYSENAKNLDTAMKLFGNYDEEDVKGVLIDIDEKINELEQSYSAVHDVFKEIKNKGDDEEFIGFLGGKNPEDGEQKRRVFYEELNNFVRVFNECMVLQDFAREFKYLDIYNKELKKLLNLRKTVNLKYADRADMERYKNALRGIVDQNVNAEGVELLTEQVDITDKKKFEEAIESLGSSKSKAEAIAAQTKRSISEKFETDPEFYQRFSDKIDDLLKKMRDGKMSDLEVLKNMKQVKEDVVGKKDATMPKVIAQNKGADILFRNLREEFNDAMPVDAFVDIILGLYEVVKRESIVDWHKNMEVKRSMMSKLDDYLYDVVRLQMGVELTQEQAQKIIEKTISLAVNNNDIFKK